MNWRETLEFPPEVPISEPATKTILRFLAIMMILDDDGEDGAHLRAHHKNHSMHMVRLAMIIVNI